MNYGYYQRDSRRLHVIKGFDPSDLKSIDHSAPVTTGVTIVAGDVIVQVNGAWVLADSGTAGHKELTPYLAYADSSDTDVKASGLLPALSCAGMYEFETARFDATQAYSTDTLLTYGTGSYAGKVVPAARVSAVTILGVVTRGGVADLGRAAGFPLRENNAKSTVGGNIKVLTFVSKLQFDRTA